MVITDKDLKERGIEAIKEALKDNEIENKVFEVIEVKGETHIIPVIKASKNLQKKIKKVNKEIEEGKYTVIKDIKQHVEDTWGK